MPFGIDALVIFLAASDERLFWKIDYYDLAMERVSENPADPTQTTRVLTISYAEDFEGDC